VGRIKDLIRGEPIHERRLEFRTYPAENDQLIVEGWLRDERLVPGFSWDGKPRLPGVVHRMCIRLLVGDWPLSILDAEAEMPGVPHELCKTTTEALKKIIGLTIVSGYSKEVLKRLGGVQSCTHLAHLVVTMGPAALHGYWTWRGRKCHPPPRSIDDFPGLTSLINSCKLWEENGPLLQKIRAILEKSGGDTC
jgi:hypothetical protein